jgi:O-acetyl-ADP-ribose deacetylase (regulator of RNase III)
VIEILSGNIFESGADALVNPVNCVGVSGKGLAKEFARRFPEAQKQYVRLCRNGELRLGEPRVIVGKPDIIVFPTKNHWRDRSDLANVAAGIRSLRQLVKNRRYNHVAVPALGCGNGGLDWDAVLPLLFHELSDLETQVSVYEPLE